MWPQSLLLKSLVEGNLLHYLVELGPGLILFFLQVRDLFRQEV